MHPEFSLPSESHPRAGADPDAAGSSDPGRLGQAATSNGRLPRRSMSHKRRRPVPIVVVHRSALFRAGLRHTFARSRFRIKVECCAFDDLPDNAVVCDDALVLLDIADIGADPVLSQIRALRDRSERIRVVLLSNQCRAAELLGFVAAGANGYLSTDEISGDGLLQSLELVLLGCVVIPREFSSTLRRGSIRLDDTTAPVAILPECGPAQTVNGPTSFEPVASLSNRERMVLRELMRGASNKHIARAINIAEATVKVHIKSLLRKIGVRNRTQAAMWAMDHCPKISVVAGLLSGAIA